MTAARHCIKWVVLIGASVIRMCARRPTAVRHCYTSMVLIGALDSCARRSTWSAGVQATVSGKQPCILHRCIKNDFGGYYERRHCIKSINNASDAYAACTVMPQGSLYRLRKGAARWLTQQHGTATPAPLLLLVLTRCLFETVLWYSRSKWTYRGYRESATRLHGFNAQRG